MKLLNKLPQSTLGLIYLITAQLCISINIVVNKYLITKSPAIILLTIRFILSGLFLGGFFRIKNNNASIISHFGTLSKKCQMALIIQGLLGGFLFNTLMLTGLNYTSATMAGIISSLIPGVIVIFSYLILREKASKNELLSILIATIGIIFINITKINQGGASLSLIGDLIILFALFPEALYTIVVKMHPVDTCSISHAAFINIINAIAFCLSLAIFPSSLLSIATIETYDWFLITSVLTLSGLMFFLLWNKGLEHATTQQAAIVTTVVPVGSCLLAFLFLHETIHLYEIIGILLVIFAICVGTIKLNKPNQNNESMTLSHDNIEPLLTNE